MAFTLVSTTTSQLAVEHLEKLNHEKERFRGVLLNRYIDLLLSERRLRMAVRNELEASMAVRNELEASKAVRNELEAVRNELETVRNLRAVMSCQRGDIGDE
jgi:hypothetical protein